MASTASEIKPFDGFPPQMFDFLQGLEDDNSRAYWEANRDTWEKDVRDPVAALMESLEPEFGSLRTFRPNRDIRFSVDKSPYKTWVGVTSSGRAVGGVGYFVRVDAHGLRVAGGAMVFARDQLDRYRDAITSPRPMAEFDNIRAAVAAHGLEVGAGKEGTYKRVPSGYDKDDPCEELLRWKGAVIVKEFPLARWMSTPKVLDKIHEIWTASTPLVDWIQKHIGSSATPVRRS